MEIKIFCDYPLTRARITAEGDVSFCSFMRPSSTKPEAYLGNVLNQTFDEVWFSDRAEEIRESTLDGNLHPQCHCPGCPFLCQKPPYSLKHTIYNEYPTCLEIDLPNTHCNIGGTDPHPVSSPACIMCERSSPDFKPQQDRLLEALERISHVVPNLSQIYVQGIAEPFWKGLFFKVLDVLKFDQHASRILMHTTTNGLLLTEDVRKEYLRRVPNSVTNFSIDATSPQTFQTLRISNEDCFHLIMENLAVFDKDRDRNRQFLRIVTNVNTINLDEVKGIVGLARRVRAGFAFGPTYGFNHKITVNSENCGRFLRVHYDIIEECKRLGVEYEVINRLDAGLSDQVMLI